MFSSFRLSSSHTLPGFVEGLRIWVFGWCLLYLSQGSSIASETNKTTELVSMRDGIRLATDVYRPPIAEAAPVILVRTPYNKDRASDTARRFAGAGYVTVIQDCRGAHASEGSLIPYNNEGQDGYDTLEWIVDQPWCNGRVGTWGSSYVGAVQWQTAVENPPGLTAMIPRATWSNFYRNLYLGGAARMLIIRWAAGNSDRPDGVMPPDDWEAVYRHLPLATVDEKIGWSIPWLQGIFAHPEPDGYWTRLNLTDRISDLQLPIQHVVGYYDFFSRESVGNFVRMREQASHAKTREQQQLILGPWDHGTIGKRQVGEVDFGPEAELDLMENHIRWFDRFLKQDPGAENQSFVPVRYFVMGDNAWREAQTWPPRDATPTPFYLRSSGRANTRFGGGRLIRSTAVTTQGMDSFIADPDDPAPACPVTEERSLVQATWAPVDQRPIEERQDVLVYKTEPLDESLTFAGNVEAKLFVSADTPDADWVVKLVDVHPDGFAQNLVMGILRGRYRNSELHPEPLVPGEVYEVTVDLGPVAATLGAGHRLQVDICGAYFPLFERNTNTGKGPFSADTRTATQHVHYSPVMPSRILLPLLK
jgi:uncharacterized protein